ncbi:MAG: hypothetical protein WCK07_11225 [Betaproteobacteria bacterium]
MSIDSTIEVDIREYLGEPGYEPLRIVTVFGLAEVPAWKHGVRSPSNIDIPIGPPYQNRRVPTKAFRRSVIAKSPVVFPCEGVRDRP